MSSPKPIPPTPLMPLGMKLKRRKQYRLRRRAYEKTPVPQMQGFATGPNLQPEVDRLRGEVERLTADADAIRAEANEANERSLRARADMENQRRRLQKEREEMRKYASEEVLQSILPAMDHFALALASMSTVTDVSSVAKGVEMIHRELLSTLQQNGLECLQATGHQFDPASQEAVGTDALPDLPDNEVTEILRPGWALRGRVIRPAMVKVNRHGA